MLYPSLLVRIFTLGSRGGGGELRSGAYYKIIIEGCLIERRT